MLNEHCVRLEKGFRLDHPTALARLVRLREWSPAQAMLLGQLHAGLVGAQRRRQELRRYVAEEILAEPELLRLTRLCGISLITLYGLISAVGDIARFANPRKLSAYFGLNPSVSQSGTYEGPTGLKRHGRGAMRALLVQAARSYFRSRTRCRSQVWRICSHSCLCVIASQHYERARSRAKASAGLTS